MQPAPSVTASTKNLPPVFRSIAVWGPGLLVMLADTDVGNVVTAAQSGAQWGYRLLPLIVLLIPLLYMVQELTVRLGIFTGMGHGELIKAQFGPRWAWLSVGGLALATIGSLVAEFTGVAGVGEIYGLPRRLTLSIAVVALLAVVLTGSYRRIEKTALIIGLFELAFFAVAWVAHPDMQIIAQHVVDIPFGNREFMYLAAALVGSVFNPWMIFYQQSALADKKLKPEHYQAARWDTAMGAVLTQLLTAAVLVAVAATLGSHGAQVTLQNVGDISDALAPILGGQAARGVFSAGVLGAAMVAAIVSSQAMAWGFGEVAGFRRSLEFRPLQAPWFYGIYIVCIVGSALLVGLVPNLVWLNIATQVANAFMLPAVIGVLIALSIKALPQEHRLRGWYLWLLVGVSVAACGVGLLGGLSIFL